MFKSAEKCSWCVIKRCGFILEAFGYAVRDGFDLVRVC